MRDTNIQIVRTNSLKNQPDSRLKYPQWAPTHQLYYHQLEGRYNSLTFLLPTTLIIICCYNNCNYNDLWSTSFAIFNINNMWSSALCDMLFFFYSNGLWYVISHSILWLYVSFTHLSLGNLSNLCTVYCPTSFIFPHSALYFIFFFWISKPLIPQEFKYFQIKISHLLHLQAYFNIYISWLFILFFSQDMSPQVGVPSNSHTPSQLLLIQAVHLIPSGFIYFVHFSPITCWYLCIWVPCLDGICAHTNIAHIFSI